MARVADIRKANIRDYQGEQIEILSPLDRGRDGIVYVGRYKAGPPLELAVKFYVPMANEPLFTRTTSLPMFARDLKARHDHELARLRALAHPSLQRYVGAGELGYDKNYFVEEGATLQLGDKVPFIASRLVIGKRFDLIEGMTRTSLRQCLCALARGIEYLHSREILHNDIRMGNVVVEEGSSVPILVDFGLSIDVSAELAQRQHTQVFLDPNPIPEALRPRIMAAKTEIGWDRQLLKNLLFPYADLYQFAGLIQEILKSRQSEHLDGFDRTFLHHLCEALCAWEQAIDTKHHSRAIGTHIMTTARDLVLCLDRWSGGADYFRRAFVQKEAAPPRTIVRSSGTVELRESLAPFLSHPALRRLHNLNQLALLHYVYPSATQSRFDHVLSALGRAQQLWRALSNRPAFLFLMDLDAIERLELAALHHDVNHFPFLHYFQEAGIPAVHRANVLETFLGVTDPPQAVSESHQVIRESLAALLSAKGVTVAYLRALMGDDPLVSYSPCDQIIRSLINSGVDVDKLAYLPDDAAFSGLRFGQGIDFDGLLAGIDVAPVQTSEGKVWHIVFEEDFIPAVESVCFSRYWNFQRLYWHHTNRAIAAMIIWTIRRLYGDNDLKLSPIDFFEYTKAQSEAGALEYLASTYATHTNGEIAPIAGLSTDRDRTYKRIFESSLETKDVLASLRAKGRDGPITRSRASKRVFEVVQQFVRQNGFARAIARSEVLLDIPLREVSLGGPIYIKLRNGSLSPATKASRVLRELEANFDLMSSTLRVFVSPRLRDGIRRSVWQEKGSELAHEIVRVIREDKERSDVT